MTKSKRKQAEEFIRIMQGMSESEQVGLLTVLEGLQLMTSKKRRIIHRS